MEKQVHVSFYASLFRTECKVLTLEEIIILIRRRRWKNEILAYRTALAEGRAEEARKLKGGLPGFTPSDRKSTRLNSSHTDISRMPSSA